MRHLVPERVWRHGLMIALVVASSALACVTNAEATPVASDVAIAVVVGKGQSPASPLSQALVVGIFARKRQLWGDRSPIVPVNLPAAHPLRRNFSRWVFDKTPEEMQAYWNDQYFHGVVPPPVLASEEAILRFVAATPGAIGYVSLCSVDRRVEVLAIVQSPDGAAPCPH